MVGTTLPYEFIGGTKAIAKQVNSNFEAVTVSFAEFNVELDKLKAEVTKFNAKPTRDSFDIFPSLLGKTPVGAYPLWTGEWIYNTRTLFKEFWAKALEYKKAKVISCVSNEDYEKKIEDFGQCGSFVIDELNGHIRLPKITRAIFSIEQLSDLAKEENDGLPDIQGSFNTGGRGGISTNDGAFYTETSGASYVGTSGPVGAALKVGFKASKSNKKYGASTEVIPKHVKLCFYIQIANNSSEISRLDTSVIAQELNDAITQLQAEATIQKQEIATVVASGVETVENSINQNVGLITTGGDAQVVRVQKVGNNLQAIGDEQVNRIEMVVKEEVDKKLPEITGKVDEIIAEGNKQVQRVTTTGTEQVNLAKAQAQEATTQANRAKAEAEKAATSAGEAKESAVNSLYYIRKLGNTSSIVLEDGKTSYPLVISVASSITFDASGIAKSGEIVFHMDIKLSALVTVDFTSANIFSWVNDITPDFSDISKHILLGFMSTDGGNTWLGSVEGFYNVSA